MAPLFTGPTRIHVTVTVPLGRGGDDLVMLQKFGPLYSWTNQGSLYTKTSTLEGGGMQAVRNREMALHRKKAFRYSRPQPGWNLPNSPYAGIIYLWRHYSLPGRVW